MTFFTLPNFCHFPYEKERDACGTDSVVRKIAQNALPLASERQGGIERQVELCTYEKLLCIRSAQNHRMFGLASMNV
jgi:hypothetical protein